MKLTHEAKIYPTQRQRLVLELLLEDCRLFYNRVLEAKINTYKETGVNIHRFELQKMFKGRNNPVPAVTRQVLIYRIDLAFKRFFTKKSSFPRFKSVNRMRSIELSSGYGFVGGKLSTFRPIGHLKMRGFRKAEKYGMARLVKKSSGWYFQYGVEVTAKRAKIVKKKIGIDLGLNYFVADSNGNTTKAPKFLRVAHEKLSEAQVLLSRAVRGSNRRSRKRQIVARQHERVANKRKDWLHKLSFQYTRKYDLIAVEDLDIKQMMGNHRLARSIGDASWGIFVGMLAYKMQILGRKLVKVDPAYTSQDCNKCGERVKKSLSTRTHECKCGYVVDRDLNAALNILKKAQQGPTVQTV